ncbi:MAG: hypothetical protein JWN80_1478 [Microbacteriaceae bacterium]|nr:hypothetical protein [Microbacteriaceae bacterium]
MISPWKQVLGDGIEQLHPKLRAYFSTIPEGSVGVGGGVFSVVGTPRRWLWPALALLGRQGIAFPAWQRDVPFAIRNHPVTDAHGRDAVLAFRTFRFRTFLSRGGERRMVDAITAERRGLVDYLGDERRWVARLSATVVGGELHLASTSFAVRLGRFEVPIPRRFAPVVELVERFDDSTDRQHVSLAITSPTFGRLYEYSGSFRYVILEQR